MATGVGLLWKLVYLSQIQLGLDEMAHKKRKRINKLKRKKKAAKQNKQPKLAYGDYLEPYLGIIEEEYKRQNVSLFRWVHYPLIPDDFKPQIFQENNPNTPEGLKIPPADAPKEVISDYTGWFTLSHFASSDDAIREWKTR